MTRNIASAEHSTRNIAHAEAMPDQQVDLLLDTIVNAPLKDDRALMEFPFFSLQKKPRMDPLVYDDGKVQIEIRSSDKGLATIWDKDVLIYVASLINERIERGLPVERTVRFAAHDLLKVTGRGTGKRSYTLLVEALLRLRGTTIFTTIKAAGERGWASAGSIPSAWWNARRGAGDR